MRDCLRKSAYEESGFKEDRLPGSDGVRELRGKGELDDLFDRLYSRIRNLASRVRGRANPTLGPTALANEVYLKLLKDPPDLTSKSTGELIAILANAMRQILIDAARRKGALKRNAALSPDLGRLRVEDALTDFLTVNALLDELERTNPRQRQIVDCRFYLGMTVDESAAALGLSATTIEREWREAKATLRRQIHLERK